MGLSAISDGISALISSLLCQPRCDCHEFKSGRTTDSTTKSQPMDITTKADTLTATANPVRLSQVARASPKLVTAAEWARKNADGKIPAMTRSTVVTGLAIDIIRAGSHAG